MYCPWAEAPYIVIDSVRRETQDLPPTNEFDRFRHAFVAASKDARHRRGEVLGWYHRHGVLGLRLSEWDLHLQEEFFPEPWHCALVIATTRQGIIGGFIQRSRRARLFRKGLAPFQEMVELDAKRVEGLRPSVVDWENYAAGEDVSVIRAKWPGAKSRLKNWKTGAHGEGVELPTQGESVAPRARKPAGRGGFAGRSWRTKPPEQPKRKPAPAADITEDDFAEAIGPDREVVFESEFTLDDTRAPAAPKKGAGSGRAAAEGKAKPAASGGQAEAKKPAAGKSPKPAAGKKDVDDGQDAWYSSDFLDAVWGPPPFEEEADEPPVAEETAKAEDAAKPVTDSKGGPRFELIPTFAAEPPESDAAGSMDWLLSLIGDTLAARPAADDAIVEPAEAPATDVAKGPSTDAHRPLPMPGGKPKGTKRPTYVATSHHPDSDPEAPIPVVFLASADKWRPSAGLKRGAAIVLVLLAGALVFQMFFQGGDEAPAPDRPAPSPIVTPGPSAEFVSLADDYLTVLQTYRADLVSFGLGRAECDAVGTTLERLTTARFALADYVVGDPDVADRFARLDNDFDVALARFETTNCPVPASVTTRLATAGSGSGG